MKDGCDHKINYGEGTVRNAKMVHCDRSEILLYASVEVIDLQLDPLTTNLVVADTFDENDDPVYYVFPLKRNEQNLPHEEKMTECDDILNILGMALEDGAKRNLHERLYECTYLRQTLLKLISAEGRAEFEHERRGGCSIPNVYRVIDERARATVALDYFTMGQLTLDFEHFRQKEDRDGIYRPTRSRIIYTDQ